MAGTVTLALACLAACNLASVDAAACYSPQNFFMQWAGWSACSATCGGGFRTRHCTYDNTQETEACSTHCLWGTVFYNDKCHCRPGTSGPCCDQTYECLSDPYPCKNGGMCNELIPGFSCSCPPGTTGDYCDDIDDCASGPCKNGGTCHEYVNYYNCSCVPGTTQPNCDDILECASNPCQNGGTCQEHVGGYTCICPAGTTGPNCVDILECASNPCQNGGSCTEMINMYNCSCNRGYTGDNCEMDLFSPHDEICRLSGSCYIVFTTSLSWNDAQVFCVAREGHLAVPNDLQEQLYLENYLQSMGDRFTQTVFWIGGQKSHMDLPTWVGGQSATEFRWPHGVTEDIPGTQCIVMDGRYNYEWQAKQCDDQTFFICEEKVPFRIVAG